MNKKKLCNNIIISTFIINIIFSILVLFNFANIGHSFDFRSVSPLLSLFNYIIILISIIAIILVLHVNDVKYKKLKQLILYLTFGMGFFYYTVPMLFSTPYLYVIVIGFTFLTVTILGFSAFLYSRKLCPNCGNLNNKNQKFCIKCGAKL